METEKALNWWHSLNFEDKFYKTIAWAKKSKKKYNGNTPNRFERK